MEKTFTILEKEKMYRKKSNDYSQKADETKSNENPLHETSGADSLGCQKQIFLRRFPNFMKTEETQQQKEDLQENLETTKTEQTEVVSETKSQTEPQNQPPAKQTKQTPFYKNRGFVGVVLVLLAALLAYMVHLCEKNESKYADKGIAYVKDDNLYVYDLKEAPYLAAETLSAGGQYHQYYSAWGTTFNENGDAFYYADNVKEDGTFDLYRRGIAKEDADVEIGTGVMDYMPSQTGEKAIFVKAGEKEQIDLYLYDGTQTVLAEKNVLAQNGSYAINGDGSRMMYQKQSENGTALYIKETKAESEPLCLHENVAMALMTKETDNIYYAGVEGETYTAYVYGHGKDGKEILQKATYMEVMPNGKDVLLMSKAEGNVLYADLVEDDLAESDAKLTETDGEAYTEKQERDAIRTAMHNGEGIEPLLQKAWIYHDNELIEIASDVISVASVNNEKPFAVCYQTAPIEKIPISEVTDLQEVEYTYYMDLMYATPKIALANAKGETYALEGSYVMPANVFLSEDGEMVGYYEANTITGTTILHVANVGGEVVMTEENVETAGFLGDTHAVAYYKDYNNGVGTMGVWENGEQQNISNVGGLHFAADKNAVYYISNINNTTGSGELYVMENGKSKRVDTDVFSMQYKFNGKVAYLKNYDVQAQKGDLYYYDGQEAKQIDTDITAIFMY